MTRMFGVTAAAWMAGQVSILRFALDKWDADFAVRIEDAYKWLFHAARGGEHAIADPQGPKDWLDREWAALSKRVEDEPLIAALRPDGRIVRINLRPYKAQGGDKAALLDAFIRSAREFRDDASSFELLWKLLGERLKKASAGPLTAAEWERLDDSTRNEGFPAIHHSEEYERVHRPGYRVLTGEHARRLQDTLGQEPPRRPRN
ncbi:MAG: hypothetical protein IH851_08745 [Armatimonadetes bacterium]|nr:hypothetical protein [Armatimonadota bacterium]